ncbi:MAG: CYTH domain-containing protein [Hyphomicrobiaceae bacterium]
MAVEIERKFLVANETWRAGAAPGQHIRQAYLSASDTNSIRIRVVDRMQAWLTIKSGYRGIERDEFEYEVPVSDAVQMLELRQSGIIEKIRYPVPAGELLWEVDVFSGANAGLVIAEVELESETQRPAMPTWTGAEVTGELRYQNSRLAAVPFSTWTSTE